MHKYILYTVMDFHHYHLIFITDNEDEEDNIMPSPKSEE